MTPLSPLPPSYPYVDLNDMAARIATQAIRLWPEEIDPGWRANNLAEEAGEVIRAITKRRHAQHASDGRCKGLTVDEWTEELAVELAQALGVILDIAVREGIDITARLTDCVVALEQRRPGA